jgi:D-cysteine desulfhydrase
LNFLLLKQSPSGYAAFSGRRSQSLRQTAAAAARYGFRCILVLVGKAPSQASSNLLLDQLFGAEIIWTEKATRDAVLHQVFENILMQGGKPYLVPYGGSSPTGALGYAFAMEELIPGHSTDWIVSPSPAVPRLDWF